MAGRTPIPKFRDNPAVGGTGSHPLHIDQPVLTGYDLLDKICALLSLHETFGFPSFTAAWELLFKYNPPGPTSSGPALHTVVVMDQSPFRIMRDPYIEPIYGF